MYAGASKGRLKGYILYPPTVIWKTLGFLKTFDNVEKTWLAKKALIVIT